MKSIISHGNHDKSHEMSMIFHGNRRPPKRHPERPRSTGAGRHLLGLDIVDEGGHILRGADLLQHFDDLRSAKSSGQTGKRTCFV